MSRRILVFLLLLTALLSANKATAQIKPFKGTWQHQDGNQRFMVKIWLDNEGVTLGHYKMVTVDGNGVHTGVVYNSNKELGAGVNFEYAINAGVYANPNKLLGVVIDNSVQGTQRGFIAGRFEMELQGTNPQTATWKVHMPHGIKVPGEPNFNIPTDIVLTKVSNDIYPD